MKLKSIAASRLVLSLCAMTLFAPQVFGQAPSNSSPADSEGLAVGSGAQTLPVENFKGSYLWTEQFNSSMNEDGQVMELDSTVGYVFSRHFGVDAGIPIFFVRNIPVNSTGGATNTSENGLGDAYLQLRLSFPNAVLNYKTALTGTAPTGSKSDGFSTGHASYDWTNHFDHAFGRWTPFADGGVGNSIPENFVFQRPFETFGHDAHFQVGTNCRITDWLGLSASAYDITTWGTQTIVSRIVGNGGQPAGHGGHGRVFEVANQTSGSSSIAADHGFSAGVDLRPSSLVDFSAGYSYSVHYQFNTFSVGVGVNVSGILHRVRASN